MAEEELDSEVLEIADTRPPLVFGMPYDLAVMIIFGSLAISNQVHNIFIGVGLLVFSWLPMAYLVRRDYNYSRIFFIWVQTAALCPSSRIFGGASVDPFRLKINSYRGCFDDADLY